MFKVKRPAIIGLLVILLVFTGYLNHKLTQQAQRRSAKEYVNHELAEMEDNMDIVDSRELEDDMEVKPVDNLEELADLDIIDSTRTSEQEGLETMYSQAASASKNYFVEYRLSRDKLRATIVDKLDQMVNNKNTSQALRDDAQKEIMKLANNSEKELQIEGLIKSRGYEDAIVFLTDEDIKVVVSTADLTEQDMVKILDIIKSETSYDNNDIKIMKKQ